jgi:hypothetical protein
VRTKPKSRFAGGFRRRRRDPGSGTIYEWDYQHGTVEARFAYRGIRSGDRSASRSGGTGSHRGAVTMAWQYKLVGYDHETEALAVEHKIPHAQVRRAKEIAGIAGRPEIIGDWQLSPAQAGMIARAIAVETDVAGYDWFLEPYETAATGG